MKLDLLYPTKTLRSVDIGMMKAGIFKLFKSGGESNLADYTLGAKILASLCGGEYSKYMDVSALDAIRIIRAAKKQYTMNNMWTDKEAYCDKRTHTICSI